MIRTAHPFGQYLIALGCTVAAYIAYAALVVPRIEGRGFDLGASAVPRPTPTPSEITPDHDILAWIPADSWEHQPCKRLEMDDGILFFQDYQPRDGGVVEVFPFTLIVKKNKPVYGPGSDQPESPIVIRASRRAELRFDRPLELGQGSAGKLIECKLEGDVNVFRREVEGIEGFNIWTRNVQMTPLRVVSLEEVRFQIGPHSGIGRHLLMDLEHKTPLSNLTSSFASIKGIARLELALVERIRLIPNPSNPAPAAAPSSPPGAWASLATAPIDILCAGPFVIDFLSQVAEFRDQVQVTRLDEFRDQLQADLLRLYFIDTPPPDATAARGSLKLARVQMQGAPARLIMPSESAAVTGALLDYDLLKGEVLGNDPRSVQIEHTNKRFSSQKLRYTLRADGGLGNLIAEGPGELEQLPAGQEAAEAFHLKWANYLTSSDASGKKLITVAGNVVAQVNHTTTVAGEKIELLLREQAVEPPPQSGQERRAKIEYAPIELLVDQQVRIRSPEIEGTARLLKLIWPNGSGKRQATLQPNPAPAAISPSHLHRVMRLSLPTAGNVSPSTDGQQVPNRPAAETNFQPIRPPVERLANPERQLPPPAPNPPSDPGLPLSVQGDIITVHLAGESAAISSSMPRDFERLEIDGKVRVAKPQATDPASFDFQISGDHLLVTPQGNGLHQCQIKGAARLETAELTMQGPAIHLNQRENRVWISGAGSLVAQPRAQAKTAVDSPRADPPTAAALADRNRADQPIHVEWQGGMIFDGERIYFEQAVRCRTEQISAADQTKSVLRSSSEALSLQLNRRVDLSGNLSHTNTNDLSVDQVILSQQIADRAFPADAGIPPPPEHVVLERTNLDGQNQPFEKQLMIVRYLSVSTTSGDIRGTGPGGIISWRKATDGDNASRFKLASQERSEKAPKKAPLQYIHANFSERLVANLHRERMLLVGNVRTLYGGVRHWEQQLDPESPQVPADAVRITCDQLDVARWQPRGAEGPTTELQALGNVRVVSQQFETTSQRLTYDELTDMLTIEGDERSAANLWQKKSPNSPANHLSAGKIRYRPSDEWTSIDDVKKATFRDLRSGK